MIQRPVPNINSPMKAQRRSSIAVVIATLNRPQILVGTVRRILNNQILKPHIVIVSCANIHDAGCAALWPTVKIVTGPPGLTKQRNAGLAALPPDVEIVAFFDDDFVPNTNWLSIAAKTFSSMPDVVGFTGHVVADGIKGPGLSFDEADKILERNSQTVPGIIYEKFSPYGCNMAFRMSALEDLRFDERLVLYGWLEDRDFGSALATKGGRLIKCMQARGVHLGVKSGRMPGDRLGYSQVANPIYMKRKGTISWFQLIKHITGNVLSNAIYSVFPEPYIDRRGRLRGNVRAFTDFAIGKIRPERALDISADR